MSEGEAQLRLASRLLRDHGVNPARLEREWPTLRQAARARPEPPEPPVLAPTPGDAPAGAGDAAAGEAGAGSRRPPPPGNMTPAACSRSGRALMADFVLSDADVEAVCDICRQLDGMPLAIELVVPLLRMAPLRHVADRLHDRVLLMSGVRRGAAPRHRTLLALFDWSYNLLDAEEQRLLRGLAVFNGGWSLDVAAAVTERRPEEVFDVLSRLVDKSLVVADLRGAAPRYALLRTIRRYASIKGQGSDVRSTAPLCPSPLRGEGGAKRRTRGQGRFRLRLNVDIRSKRRASHPHPSPLRGATFSRQREKGTLRGPALT